MYAQAAKINSRRKASYSFSGAPDSSILRLTPTIIPSSMEATISGSVASGSQVLPSMRTIALCNRAVICCAIFIPSTSELTEYKATLVLPSFISA